MINEGGRGEIVNLPSGAQVIPHDISMAMAANSNNSAPQQVHVTVGVSVDESGNLQAYVKDVSQGAVSEGLTGYVKSDAFVQHVSTAATKGRARRLG